MNRLLPVILGITIILGSLIAVLLIHQTQILNSQQETIVYGCGVIAGQQLILQTWNETPDCAEVRTRAIANGLTAMKRPE